MRLPQFINILVLIFLKLKHYKPEMGGYHRRKTCFETVRNLSGKVDYENRSKKRTQDFSWNRKISFKKLMWFMFSLMKECSQNALERFFPKMNLPTILRDYGKTSIHR
jgi:hypothetical protein